MAKRGAANAKKREGALEGTGNGAPAPRSLTIADTGIRTSRDFRDLMSAIMSDVIAGRITPGMTNAACNAGGKLLRMVELEQKYATRPEGTRRTLTVAFEEVLDTPLAEIAAVS